MLAECQVLEDEIMPRAERRNEGGEGRADEPEHARRRSRWRAVITTKGKSFRMRRRQAAEAGGSKKG